VGREPGQRALRGPDDRRRGRARRGNPFARPPNPNAARVFVNWALSRDGQMRWVQIMQNQGTRRLDVPVPPELALDPRARYPLSVNKEEAVPILERAMDVAKEFIQ
jgi:ABC-type Fe3+ transport system substrate-binding protein